MNMGQPITVTVNGDRKTAEVEPRLLLVHFLREKLRLTGTHIGCDTTHCGACTVLVDGTPVKSCTMLAVQADGQQVTTVEGFHVDVTLTPSTKAAAKASSANNQCTSAVEVRDPRRSIDAHIRLKKTVSPHNVIVAALSDHSAEFGPFKSAR